MSSQNLENLSQDELNKILKEEYEKNRKLKKERSIKLIRKLRKQNEKLSKVKSKSKFKTKSKSKFKTKSKSKSKSKSFQHYYQECIKDKDIPKDAPAYLKKALEKAKKEYEKGIILEKSALANFAEKYNIKGIPKLLPIEYFKEKAPQIKDFLRKYRNTKVRMILVCEMEMQATVIGSISTYKRIKAYFQSHTYINLEKTDEKVFLREIIKEILFGISDFQESCSGWYFKEVIRLEIHIVDYKPMKGASYIPLPEFIQKKNAIINIKNEDDKCFLWSVLRYLHPVQKNGERINDLKKYENDLNFKQINFPVQVKDITKFENQNPNLPGINVFSVDDNNRVYPLRTNQKDCQKSLGPGQTPYFT